MLRIKGNPSIDSKDKACKGKLQLKVLEVLHARTFTVF